MPRDGSGVYTKPYPPVTSGTTIESLVYNGQVDDVTQDLNTPRPITSGGTGANNAVDAANNLGLISSDGAQTLTEAKKEQARANIGVPDANVIINGDFRINQSGYVSAAVLAAGAYGHDQWKAGASGGDYSFTQLNSSTQITIASGKSLIQPVEVVNVAGGSYVLSWTGTAQARAGINTLTPAGSYAASPLLIAGQTAGTAMSVEFNTGTLGVVKLEPGTISTPFVMRPYDQELLACQRYWYKQSTQIISGYNGAGGGIYDTYEFAVQMRATPTLTFGSPSGSNAQNIAAMTLTSSFLRASAAIIATGGGYVTFDFTADARL